MLCLYTFTRRSFIPLATIEAKLGKHHYNTSQSLSEDGYGALVSFLENAITTDPIRLKDAVNAILAEEYVSLTPDMLLIGEDRITFQYEEEPRITLVSSDGIEIYLTGAAQSMFTLVRDFSGEYPGKSIPVPYTAAIIRLILSPCYNSASYNYAPLVSCLNCLKHLNPVSNLYYLAFDLEGIEKEEMMSIAKSLTREERIILRDIGTRDGYDLLPPLPHGGEGHYILTASRSARAPDSLREELFSDCPSWLVYFLLLTTSYKRNPSLVSLLLTADFSQDYGYLDQVYVIAMISNVAMLFRNGSVINWDDAKNLLAACGVRHAYLQNEASTHVLPYGNYVPLIEAKKYFEPLGTVLAPLYPGTWDENVYQGIFSP